MELLCLCARLVDGDGRMLLLVAIHLGGEGCCSVTSVTQFNRQGRLLASATIARSWLLRHMRNHVHYLISFILSKIDHITI
jgi:hypothetical protein